ncbi:glycoside hydrolase family 57 protein [bacterium]|nr:glycoside hydrolase family 57 protein [bacterium]
MLLKLAILWHNHQPYYKNFADGFYLLPWVRLHALKDYWGMVYILREFPAIRQNFNLVPSLLEQLHDYATGQAYEAMLDLSLTSANKLGETDKSYLLRYFFYTNKNVVERFPRYFELLVKRGIHGTGQDMEKARSHFTIQDYLDLQVLQKLAWMDEEYLEKDPDVSKLVEKGRHYDENDKALLHQKEVELLRRVVSEYQDAAHRGQIEVSVSAVYHPILPLLVSSRVARESQPLIQLPMSEFSHPEDARAQILKALKYHNKIFGENPAGFWPPEGGISESILPLLAEAGIRWTGTDEEILLHSIEKAPVLDKARWCAEHLYTPYTREVAGGQISIIFRDHVLSDLIGFSYSRIPAEQAAADFMKRLHELSDRIKRAPSDPPPLVTIILDGENAWEYYPHNGRDFLKALYKALSTDPEIQTTTIQQYISEFPGRPLERLFAGSWINHNFAIWIGHPEDNKAWNFLKEARDQMEYSTVNEPQKAVQIEKAYEEILIAEGSDWFWWFGDEHSSENDPEFDRLFRQHITNVYHFLEKPVPETLLLPIKAPRAGKLIYRVPRRFVNPKLDGKVTNYFEWLTAGHYYVADQIGTMHRAETLIKQTLFGFDLENAYLRVDPQRGTAEELFRKGFQFQILFLPAFILSIGYREDGTMALTLERERDDTWLIVDHHCEVGIGQILEVKVPFADLDAGSGDVIRFRITLSKSAIVFEEHPQSGSIHFQVPGPHFEEINWEV